MTRKMSDAEAKRTPLNMRTTAALRSRIEAAAGESCRSLCQEVEFRLEASFAAADLRTIIREEIRAALGVVGPFSDPKEFTASLRQAVADLPDEERRMYGPRPALIGNDLRGYQNTLGAMSGTYGQTRSDLGTGMSQIHDRSALNGKQ